MISPGLYRHYKGSLYIVFAVAQHSETGELMVIYRELTKEGAWVRPLAMFEEEVLWPDGVTRPRFSFQENRGCKSLRL